MSENFRLRIGFGKIDRLRWLSHLELTRAMERLVRRSGLPYLVTQGFNKHMRFAIGPALPVGTAGEAELFDVWLTDYVPLPQVMQALTDAAAGMVPMVSAQYVAPNAKGLQATHTSSSYLILVEATGYDAESLQAALDALMISGSIEVPHKKKTKSFVLSEVVIEPLTVVAAAGEQGQFLLGCTLRSLASGSLRPEQMLAAVLGEAVVVMSCTRTGLDEE